MPADATLTYIALSPAYRQAQRVMAQWLDYARDRDARHTRVAWRTAWTALDTTERDHLLRWLAWLCIAAASRGDRTLRSRLRQLDAGWGPAITHAMHKLPAHRHGAPGQHHRLRLSA